MCILLFSKTPHGAAAVLHFEVMTHACLSQRGLPQGTTSTKAISSSSSSSSPTLVGYLRSSMAPKVLKHVHLPQHFCHCNIFDILVVGHRMFTCQKIMLSQALEMCTQFTPFKDDIYSRCTIKKSARKMCKISIGKLPYAQMHNCTVQY